MRISIVIPVKGRGSINHASGLTLTPKLPPKLGSFKVHEGGDVGGGASIPGSLGEPLRIQLGLSFPDLLLLRKVSGCVPPCCSHFPEFRVYKVR